MKVLNRLGTVFYVVTALAGIAWLIEPPWWPAMTIASIAAFGFVCSIAAVAVLPVVIRHRNMVGRTR